MTLNALAETEIGLFKTELINRRGPWRTRDDVELATLEWIDWSTTATCTQPAQISPLSSTSRSITVKAQPSPRRWSQQHESPTTPGAVQNGVRGRVKRTKASGQARGIRTIVGGAQRGRVVCDECKV
jgi:hypothetical protein